VKHSGLSLTDYACLSVKLALNNCASFLRCFVYSKV